MLDTHILLWFLSGNSRLSQEAKSSIENPLYKKSISVASLWEITIKLSLGKLQINFDVSDMSEILEANEIEISPIEMNHLIHLSSLALHHKDPFDRLIIAQAICHNMTLITIDRQFQKYKELKIIN